MNGILTRESDLTRHLNCTGLHPHRNGFDNQPIVGLQSQVGAGLATSYGGEIHRDQLRLASVPVDNIVSRQFRLTPVRRIFQAAAGANQIADMHYRFQRIHSRHFHSSIDTDHLFGLVRRRLQREIP